MVRPLLGTTAHPHTARALWGLNPRSGRSLAMFEELLCIRQLLGRLGMGCGHRGKSGTVQCAFQNLQLFGLGEQIQSQRADCGLTLLQISISVCDFLSEFLHLDLSFDFSLIRQLFLGLNLALDRLNAEFQLIFISDVHSDLAFQFLHQRLEFPASARPAGLAQLCELLLCFQQVDQDFFEILEDLERLEFFEHLHLFAGDAGLVEVALGDECVLEELVQCVQAVLF